MSDNQTGDAALLQEIQAAENHLNDLKITWNESVVANEIWPFESALVLFTNKLQTLPCAGFSIKSLERFVKYKNLVKNLQMQSEIHIDVSYGTRKYNLGKIFF